MDISNYLGHILAFLSIIITVIIYFKQKKTRKVIWCFTPVQWERDVAPPHSPFRDLSVGILEIGNYGNEPITAESFSAPLIFKNTNEHKYPMGVSYAGALSNLGRQAINMRVLEDKSLEISPFNINPGEVLWIPISGNIVADWEGGNLEAHIVGLSEFRNLYTELIDKGKRFRTPLILALVAACVIFNLAWPIYIASLVFGFSFSYVYTLFSQRKYAALIKKYWMKNFQTKKSEENFISDNKGNPLPDIS